MVQASLHLATNVATVSRRIKRLNDIHERPIFVKANKEWVLTQEGQAMFDLVQHFNDDMGEIRSKLGSGYGFEQSIKISASEFVISNFLVPHLSEISSGNKHINLSLRSEDQVVSLAYGEADIALRLSRPAEGRLVSKRLTSLKIGPFRPKGVEVTNWIGLPTALEWTPEMKLANEVFGGPPNLRLASFEAIITAAKLTGMGGIAPGFMLQNDPDIEFIQPCSQFAQRGIWMVYHESRRRDFAMRRVAEWIQKHIQQEDSCQCGRCN